MGKLNRVIRVKPKPMTPEEKLSFLENKLINLEVENKQLKEKLAMVEGKLSKVQKKVDKMPVQAI